MILALADDLTGALEAGAKFAEYGFAASVITEGEHTFSNGTAIHLEAEVTVVDTETRHLAVEEAQAVVRNVIGRITPWPPRLIYKKTDSTLRGNIAAELRALHEAFPGHNIIYSPAYPQMGRTVRNGELFVWGKRVHETEFATDALNPITDCRIANPLGNLPITILDGETENDIKEAAHLILQQSRPHLCAGPAALASSLGCNLSEAVLRPIENIGSLRTLVVNGSKHPVSIAQMEAAEEEDLFEDGWARFDEPVEGLGLERAAAVAEEVKRTLSTTPFDALIVFGGDTAYAIHRSLGGGGFKPLGEMVTGVPVSMANGFFWLTKAGGFGSRNLLSIIRRRMK